MKSTINFTECKSILVLVVIALLTACNSKTDETKQEKEITYVDNPVAYVNPFHGTAPLTNPDLIGYTPPENWRVWAGLTYPGATLPNAMVQLSPITAYGSGAGYEYEAKEIIGFTHTNKGHWNLCNLPVLPVDANASYPYKSSFDKATEKASANYYEVTLKDYNVNVKLTTTPHVGVHQYTFLDDEKHQLLFDLGRANNHVDDWEIKKIDEHTLQGFQKTGRDKVHFYAVVSETIGTVEKVKEHESNGYALVPITSTAKKVMVKISLSYVSIANAKANLEAEIQNEEFEEIQNRGVATWNTLLSKIEVSGGTALEKELFYSSLYRTFQWPALRSDVNGDFVDDAGSTQNKGFKYYTIPSLWDTYRNKLVLLAMFRPEVTGDVIQSLVDRGELSGFMPTFFHGDHAASFVAQSYAKGIKNFEVENAYKQLLNNAYNEGGTRPFIKEYIKKGYISDPDVAHPNVETKAKAGVSKTLEYAHDDYSLAILAKALNDNEHSKELFARSKNYKNVFDNKTRFMRGKLENGSWISPFDPQYPYYEYMYREANAWQVSFYAPHDMDGLVTLYGGKKAFENKLDSLFSYQWNPNHIARNVSSFIGQYCHGNQPDHEAPFAYYFAGKPEKSQQIIDKILNEYYAVGDNKIAMSGMDDAGEMSAWYVFAAAGLYPLSPADNTFLITVPVFDQVRWHIGENSFIISHTGSSRNFNKLQLNEENLESYFISYDSLKNGGSLKINSDEVVKKQ